MTKNTQNSRDRRRVATGRDLSDFDYEPLKAHDWNVIQDKLGTKLQKDLREQLSGITMLYAAANIPRSTRPLSEIVQEIDLWRKQTEVLIKNVWDRDFQIGGPNTEKLTLEQISERYFRFAHNIVTSNYPLGQLAHFLEGTVAVSNHFIQTLRNPQFKNERKTELWLVWAALVISCCRDSGIELTKPKMKSLHPGITILLDKLQNTVKAQQNPTTQTNVDCKPTRKHSPLHVRLPIGVPVKTGASLAKNARRALALAEGDTTADLFLLFSMWLFGLSQFGTGRLVDEEMKPVLARLNEQMKIISPKQNGLND